jgi:hypothetical protein
MAEKREHFLKIYFSKAELERLLERIPENVATSVWIRRLALHEDMEELYKKFRPSKDPDLVRHIAQVNVALNGLARALSKETPSSEPLIFVKILSFLFSIEEKLSQILKKRKS